jgi:pheromone a factor receptor
MYGVVPVDKWGQVATGYVVFFVFGTGSDAYNTYKKMLLAMGLGRFFPSLYIMRESGASTPSSFINARTWTSSISSKAKGMFWSRTNSMAYTLGDTTRQNSIAKSSIQRKQSLVREQPFPSQNASQRSGSSFYNRVFGRQAHDTPALPLFVDYRSRSVNEMPDTSTRMRDLSPGATAHAWAVDKLSPGLESESKSVGVRVLHEVRLEHEQLEEQAKARKLNDTMA